MTPASALVIGATTEPMNPVSRGTGGRAHDSAAACARSGD